jgi:ubiquinone/menaquinone biosynthesis C-methylase UbiE
VAHERAPVSLPYIDRLLAQLDHDQSPYRQSFGRHIHWGYWPEPTRATPTPEDFAAAAERLSDEICAAGEVRDGQRILDVGCGFGGTIARLNERLAGVDLVGLNIDDRQLARAKTLVESRPANHVQFELGDACALPFDAASFDVVLAVESIFHFRDRRSFLREARRVLRPGGHVALSDFVPVRYVHFKSGSFYGPINLRCSATVYRQLAAAVGLVPYVERDVTAQTTPTFRFLRRLERTSNAPLSIRAQTRLLEALTRSGFLRYMIWSFAADPGPHSRAHSATGSPSAGC